MEEHGVIIYISYIFWQVKLCEHRSKMCVFSALNAENNALSHFPITIDQAFVIWDTNKPIEYRSSRFLDSQRRLHLIH